MSENIFYDPEPVLALWISTYPQLAEKIIVDACQEGNMWHTNPSHSDKTFQNLPLSACTGVWCEDCAADLYVRETPSGATPLWHLSLMGHYHEILRNYSANYQHMANHQQSLQRHLDHIHRRHHTLTHEEKDAYQSALHQGELLDEYYTQLLQSKTALDWLTTRFANEQGGTPEDFDLTGCLVAYPHTTVFSELTQFLAPRALRTHQMVVLHVNALLAREIHHMLHGRHHHVQIVHAANDDPDTLETAAALLEPPGTTPYASAHQSLHKALQSARRLHAERTSSTCAPDKNWGGSISTTTEA